MSKSKKLQKHIIGCISYHDHHNKNDIPDNISFFILLHENFSYQKDRTKRNQIKTNETKEKEHFRFQHVVAQKSYSNQIPRRGQ